MLEGLDKLAGSVGKAVEAVPELYEDAIQPAAKESGKIMALVPQAVNAIFADLRIWIANREYKVAEAEKLLTKKLERLDSEKIVPPEPYVAIPALEAFLYSIECKELRDLYLNLLGHSIYKDTKYKVHPAFVGIIIQMSPLDAKVFEEIMKRSVNPCINLIAKNDQGAFRDLMQNITDFTFSTPELISVSIENLKRMNLIYIPADEFYKNETVYDSILNSPFYKEQELMHPETEDGYKFSYKKSVFP